MLKLTRIDGRLIHGQVLTGYVRQHGINLIIVANDHLSQSPFEQKLMKMIAPSGVEVEILSVDDVGKGLTDGKWDQDSVLLLIKSPIDFVRLYDLYPEFEKINVGGVHNEGGKIKITKEVSATEDELEAWKKINELGVTMELQWDREKSISDFNKIIANM